MQQRHGQCLALRVDAQRPAGAARQDIVQHEVHGEEVRGFIAIDPRRIQAVIDAKGGPIKY